MPMSKMITMHMALKQILLTRHQKLEALKTDRYLADADWQRVEELTKVEGSHYGIEDDGQVKHSPVDSSRMKLWNFCFMAVQNISRPKKGQKFAVFRIIYCNLL